MRLTGINEEMRKRDKLGASVNYELEMDHLGGAIGKRTATFHLSDGLVLELHDLTDAAASVVRQTVSDALWAKLDAIVDALYADGRTEDDLAAALEDGQAAPAVEDAASWREWGEARGAAQGIAYAIALLANPRLPSVDWIRDEAARRYQEPQS